MSKEGISIHWFRRDLRLEDNPSLYHALKSGKPVVCLFVFDTDILSALNDRYDRRVSFIFREVNGIQALLRKLGSDLLVKVGKPIEVWRKLLTEMPIKEVFANRDYEPYARERDKAVYELLQLSGVTFKAYKDHVIFEKDEVLKDNGTPYTVFTPYSKRWKANLNAYFLTPYPVFKYTRSLHRMSTEDCPDMKLLGFEHIDPGSIYLPLSDSILDEYARMRDFPAANGTSKLSVHLRFGTVSIRALATAGLARSETWLNELIWRDFYQMILWHFPHSATDSFRSSYDRIEWENDELRFEAWCIGQTGYPLVDAGMRELNQTGFMHNRVRMVVASFLSKHLLIDWRWGERYFAEKLLDFDLASNTGGWQWAAGCGCDAAPYFRIFNPAEQLKKFDPDMLYTKKWVSEVGTSAYPPPIVDHRLARERALRVYKSALQ